MIRQRRPSSVTPVAIRENESVILLKKLSVMALFGLVAYAAYTAIGVLVVLLASALLVAIVSPFLNRMNARRIPDWVGILIVFAVA